DLSMEDLPRLDGLRVLVVDDWEDAREMITETLGECGAAVAAAASGREALELIEKSEFDALVCDIAMPEMDGYDLMRRLRATETGSGRFLPAIALTALARTEDRLATLKAGFQTHITKPVKLAELIVVLDNIARLYQREQS